MVPQCFAFYTLVSGLLVVRASLCTVSSTDITKCISESFGAWYYAVSAVLVRREPVVLYVVGESVIHHWRSDEIFLVFR